MVTRA
jgi:hypothetical protein